MPIDIQAFRSITGRSDQESLFYVKDNNLMATTARDVRSTGSVHQFKAATKVFLDAYRRHYGAALGQMASNTLQEYVEMGRPLSARVVKALVDFSDKFVDENMGSGKSVKVGDVEVDLTTICTDKLLSTGVFKSTKIRNALKGGLKAAAETFTAITQSTGGTVDVPGLLRHLETLHSYAIRDAAAQGPLTRDALVKSFEKLLFKGIDALDNRALSCVYQGLVSREIDALKKELARIVDRPNANPVAVAAAEKFFTAICRMEAMIVSEVSRRMEIAKAPEGEVQNVPSLMEKYCGDAAVAANRFGGDKDMTTLNLGIMTRLAAQGSVEGGRIDKKTNATLKERGINGVGAKQIGDMIRGNELTINFHLGAVMGGRRNGTVTQSLFKKPNAQIINTFQSKEEQNLALDGTGYLKLRNEVEKSFFPEYAREPLKGKDRPAYGALNTRQMASGAADTNQGVYGRVVIVLKEHVKRLCTYTLDDTFFASTLKLTPDMRPQLEENLVEAFASKLKDPAAVLAGLKSDRGPLGLFMGRNGGDKVRYEEAKVLSGNIATLFNSHRADGVPAIEAYDVFAYLTANYANHDDNTRNVATYDNVENLLSGKGEFSAVNMAVSTMKRDYDPTYRIAFEGTNYIEAQVHGPIMLDRDVEEVRFDVADFSIRARDLYAQLSQEERDGIEADPRMGDDARARKEKWIADKAGEVWAQVREEVKGVPFKVTFYNSEKTREAAQAEIVYNVNDDKLDTVKKLKGELVGQINSLVGKANQAEIIELAMRKTGHAGETAKRLWGANLENAPDWFFDMVDADLRGLIPSIGTDVAAPKDRNGIIDNVAGTASLLLYKLDDAVKALDACGVDDAADRTALIETFLKSGVAKKHFRALINCHLAEKDVLSDLPGHIKAMYDGIPKGKVLYGRAYNGLPPVGGKALEQLVSAIKLQGRILRNRIVEDRADADTAKEDLIERLRWDAILETIAKRTKLLANQADWEFPSNEERNVFISWASSAGMLRYVEELKGVYESSTALTDALAEKLANGATPTVQDIISAYKAFYPVCLRNMELDKRNYRDYGAEERTTAISRAVSVAMGRLAVRLGDDAMRRLAAAFDSPEARALFGGALVGTHLHVAPTQELAQNGEYIRFATFMQVFYERIPEKFGYPLAMPTNGANVPPAAIPPAVRQLLRQINATQADALDAIPYNPNVAVGEGFRLLVRMAPPANPAAMPQDKAARKNFLVEMLHLYHGHEKGFDKGTNYHGRTHATRTFVLSTAMANILREKGVALDMNAVALVTAGHDTGRTANGDDTERSETRSAENVNAAVDRLYPGAAGDAWKAQVKTNVISKSVEQTTIEGHVFKSADSLDYFRVGTLDRNRFLFLRDDLVTENGVVVAADPVVREQLIKEAERLTMLTAPSYRLRERWINVSSEVLNAATDAEAELKAREKRRIEEEMARLETAQTETLSDQQIVELVEKSIRDNPQDFPLLTKYYLNAA